MSLSLFPTDPARSFDANAKTGGESEPTTRQRAPYAAPKLTIYGDVLRVTDAATTSSMNMNDGGMSGLTKT